MLGPLSSPAQKWLSSAKESDIIRTFYQFDYGNARILQTEPQYKSRSFLEVCNIQRGKDAINNKSDTI